MSKLALKSFHLIILSLAVIAFTAAFAGATDDADVHDTVELKNGDIVTGTVSNDTFTVTTPYTNATCERDKISEINIGAGNGNYDMIVLKTGGLLEGTIEERTISLKSVTGEVTSFKKEQCKKIILK